MSKEKYVLGIDFGTDSVRALIVDANTGAEVSTHVVNFSRWGQGKYCNPSAAPIVRGVSTLKP